MSRERVGRIVIERTGGPEVLSWQEVDLPELGPHDVLIAIKYAGICHSSQPGA